jgi:hypothetical protein
MRLDPAADEMWYLPSFSETARLLGWRWILLLPAGLLAVALLIVPLHPGLIQFLDASWKLAIIVIALPFTLFAKQARSILQARRDPFCIHCGYGLTGLPDHHQCPECGRPYSLAIVEEYRRDPHWFIQRYRNRHNLPPRDVPFDAGTVRRTRKSRDGT